MQVGGSSSVGSGDASVGSASAQQPAPVAAAASPASAAASPASSGANKEMLWPAWVYCTRYSDRPSSGEFHLLSTNPIGW